MPCALGVGSGRRGRRTALPPAPAAGTSVAPDTSGLRTARPGPAAVRPDGLLRRVASSEAATGGGIGAAPCARYGPPGPPPDGPCRPAARRGRPSRRPPGPRPVRRLDLFHREVPVRAVRRRYSVTAPTPTPAYAVAASALSQRSSPDSRPVSRRDAWASRRSYGSRGESPPSGTRPGALRTSRGPRSLLGPASAPATTSRRAGLTARRNAGAGRRR